jgi:hypothetical protein
MCVGKNNVRTGQGRDHEKGDIGLYHSEERNKQEVLILIEEQLQRCQGVLVTERNLAKYLPSLLPHRNHH